MENSQQPKKPQKKFEYKYIKIHKDICEGKNFDLIAFLNSQGNFGWEFISDDQNILTYYFLFKREKI